MLSTRHSIGSIAIRVSNSILLSDSLFHLVVHQYRDQIGRQIDIERLQDPLTVIAKLEATGLESDSQDSKSDQLSDSKAC